MKKIDAIRAGASGYLLKGAERDRIIESILEVRSGGSVIQPSLARRLLKHFSHPEPEAGVAAAAQTAAATPPEAAVRRPDGDAAARGYRALTEREVEILRLIAKGLSNNEAATVLGLSKATIRTHLEHIYSKLEVTNRVEAVTEGIRQGLIEV
jgi:DNA-binding NarL/FixJ family response regulator